MSATEARQCYGFVKMGQDSACLDSYTAEAQAIREVEDLAHIHDKALLMMYGIVDPINSSFREMESGWYT